MSALQQKAWSPYVTGIIVGLLQIPALLIISSPLGASSWFVSIGGYIASIFDADVQQYAYLDKYMTSLKYLWQGTFVVFIAVGAAISSRMSGTRRKQYSPIWRKALDISLLQRLTIGFIGGFILLFGARWAGGCTTGHGVSGVGQLAVGSIVVAVFMFVGGMLVSNLFRRL